MRWAPDRRLLVGHGTSRHPVQKEDAGRKRATDRNGQPSATPAQQGVEVGGLLTVVDTKRLAVKATYRLDGGCIALTVSDRARVYLIARDARRHGKEELHRDALYQIDLRTRSLIDRLPLPTGARAVVFGPRGLLLVPLSSGTGLYATDATVAVVDPLRLRLLYRQRPRMIVRALRTFHDPSTNDARSVMQLLRYNGDAWVQLLEKNHQSGFEYLMDQLPTGQLAVVDGIAYLPMRAKQQIERVDLVARKRLAPLEIPTVATWDKSGLLRTRQVFSPRGSR